MPRPLDDGFTQDYPTPHLDAMDAANEIENLRSDIERLQAQIQFQQDAFREVIKERDALQRLIDAIPDREVWLAKRDIEYEDLSGKGK